MLDIRNTDEDDINMLLAFELVLDATNTVLYVNINVIIIWGGNIQALVSFITWNWCQILYMYTFQKG